MIRLCGEWRARWMQLVFATGLTLSLSATSALGDETTRHGSPQLDRGISLGELHPTPEMWIYQQEMKAYLDPKLAVRRKAEYRAAQRQQRIAAAEWFGYSKARPIASATPFMDTYSPRWGSNTANPNVWSGPSGGSPIVIETPGYGGLRRY